jgi:hypothetical protein
MSSLVKHKPRTLCLETKVPSVFSPPSITYSFLGLCFAFFWGHLKDVKKKKGQKKCITVVDANLIPLNLVSTKE